MAGANCPLRLCDQGVTVTNTQTCRETYRDDVKTAGRHIGFCFHTSRNYRDPWSSAFTHAEIPWRSKAALGQNLTEFSGFDDVFSP